MEIQVKSQADGLVAQNKLVERTGKGFTDGVCSGYLTYYDQYQGKPITDLDVYAFLIQNILDVHDTDTFNAGYCTGWIEALLEDRKFSAKMTTHPQIQPLVQITDPDFQAGFEEAQEPCYAGCGIHDDLGLIEVVRSMLTEYAIEIGLSEQQLRRSTGFIIGILSR